MKTKAVITISIILVVIGAIAVAAAFFMVDFDFTKLNTAEFVETEYLITEDFSSIVAAKLDCDIILSPSQDGTCRIVCHTPKSYKFSAKVSDSTLVFEQMPRKWYQYININFGFPKAVLYLPKGNYENLMLSSKVSDIEIPDGFSFENVNIKTNTGNVTIDCSVERSIKIDVDTGAVSISGYPVEDIYVESDTGKITISDNLVRNRLYVESDTGRVNIKNVECFDAQIETDTGSVSFENVIAFDSIKITSDTGSVKLDGCDAMKIYVETDTGSVSGKLLSEMTFFAESDTGKVNVPKTISEKVCEISTDTGSITFE